MGTLVDRAAAYAASHPNLRVHHLTQPEWVEAGTVAPQNLQAFQNIVTHTLFTQIFNTQSFQQWVSQQPGLDCRSMMGVRVTNNDVLVRPAGGDETSLVEMARNAHPMETDHLTQRTAEMIMHAGNLLRPAPLGRDSRSVHVQQIPLIEEGPKIRNLEAEILRLQEQLKELTAERGAGRSSSEVERLENRLEAMERHQEAATQDLLRATERAAHAEGVLEGMRPALNASQERVHELSREVHQLTMQASQVELMREELNRALEEKTASSEELRIKEDALLEATRDAAAARATLERLQPELDTANARNQELQEQVVALSREAAKAEQATAEAARLRGQIDQKDREIQDLSERAGRADVLDRENQELRTELRAARAEIGRKDEAQAQHAAELARATSAVERLQQEHLEKDERLERLEAQVRDLSAQRETHLLERTRLEERERAVAARQEELNLLSEQMGQGQQAQIEDLQARLSEKDQQLATQRERIERLAGAERLMEQSRLELDALRQQAGQLPAIREQLAATSAELGTLQGEKERALILEAELRDATGRAAGFEEQARGLEAAQRELATLRTQATEGQRSQARLEETQRRVEQLERAEGQLRQAQQEVAQLQERTKNYEQLERDVERLREAEDAATNAQSLLREKEREVAAQRDMLEGLQRDAREHQQAREDLRETAARLDERTRELEQARNGLEELDAAKHEAGELRERLAGIVAQEPELLAARERLATLEGELREATARAAELQGRVDPTEEALRTSRREVESLQRELRELRPQVEEGLRAQATLRSMEDDRGEIAGLRGEVAAANDRAHQMELENVRLQERLEGIEAVHEAEIERIEERCHLLEAELASAHRAVEEAHELQREVEDARQADEPDGEQNRAMEALQERLAAAEEAAGRVAGLEEELQGTRRVVQRLRAVCQAYTSQRARDKQRIDELEHFKGENAALNQELLDLRNQMHRREGEYRAALIQEEQKLNEIQRAHRGEVDNVKENLSSRLEEAVGHSSYAHRRLVEQRAEYRQMLTEQGEELAGYRSALEEQRALTLEQHEALAAAQGQVLRAGERERALQEELDATREQMVQMGAGFATLKEGLEARIEELEGSDSDSLRQARADLGRIRGYAEDRDALLLENEELKATLEQERIEHVDELSHYLSDMNESDRIEHARADIQRIATSLGVAEEESIEELLRLIKEYKDKVAEEAEYTQRNGDLSSRLDRASKELEELRAAQEPLAKRIAELEGIRKEQNRRNQELSDQLLRQSQQNVERLVAAADSEELESLRAQHQTNTQRIRSLEEQATLDRAAIESAQSRADLAEGSLRDANRRADGAQQENRILREEAATSQRRVLEVEAELAELREASRAKSAAAVDEKRGLHELREVAADLAIDMEQLQSYMTRQEILVRPVLPLCPDTQQASFSLEFEACIQELKQLRTQRDRSAIVAAIRRARTSLQREYSRCFLLLRDASQLHKGRADRLEQGKKDVTLEKVRHSREIAGMREEHERTISELGGQIITERARADEATRLQEETARAAALHEAKANELTQTNDTLQQRVEALESENGSLERTGQVTLERNGQLVLRNQELHRQVEAYEKEVSILRGLQESFLERLKEIQLEAEDDQQQLDRLVAALAEEISRKIQGGVVSHPERTLNSIGYYLRQPRKVVGNGTLVNDAGQLQRELGLEEGLLHLGEVVKKIHGMQEEQRRALEARDGVIAEEQAKARVADEQAARDRAAALEAKALWDSQQANMQELKEQNENLWESIYRVRDLKGTAEAASDELGYQNRALEGELAKVQRGREEDRSQARRDIQELARISTQTCFDLEALQGHYQQVLTCAENFISALSTIDVSEELWAEEYHALTDLLNTEIQIGRENPSEMDIDEIGRYTLRMRELVALHNQTMRSPRSVLSEQSTAPRAPAAPSRPENLECVRSLTAAFDEVRRHSPRECIDPKKRWQLKLFAEMLKPETIVQHTQNETHVTFSKAVTQQCQVKVEEALTHSEKTVACPRLVMGSNSPNKTPPKIARQHPLTPVVEGLHHFMSTRGYRTRGGDEKAHMVAVSGRVRGFIDRCRGYAETLKSQASTSQELQDNLIRMIGRGRFIADLRAMQEIYKQSPTEALPKEALEEKELILELITLVRDTLESLA